MNSIESYTLELGQSKLRYYKGRAKQLDAASPLPFAHQEDLQALVLGWPWLAKMPSLLFGPENDQIYFTGNGGARCDALGLTRAGRLVSVELPLEPFAHRKLSLRRLLRGLQRLDQHRSQAARHFGPYAAAEKSSTVSPALCAFFIGDADQFPKDNKQVKKIAKDFRALLNTPAERWDAQQHGKTEKLDQATPAWLQEIDIPVQLTIMTVLRFVSDKSRFVLVERHLRQDFLSDAKRL